VIDTVGVKTDRTYAMIDMFGTPYTASCQISWRRLRHADYAGTWRTTRKEQERENWLCNGDVWSGQRNKQVLPT